MNQSLVKKWFVHSTLAQIGLAVVFTAVPIAQAHAGVPVQNGIASWHDPSKGQMRTASNRPWAGAELIAAHRTLPMGSKVRVVNLTNGRSVVVEIRDRGPYRRGRIIDVSRRAARELGLIAAGTARVRLEAADDAARPKLSGG